MQARQGLFERVFCENALWILSGVKNAKLNDFKFKAGPVPPPHGKRLKHAKCHHEMSDSSVAMTGNYIIKFPLQNSDCSSDNNMKRCY